MSFLPVHFFKYMGFSSLVIGQMSGHQRAIQDQIPALLQLHGDVAKLSLSLCQQHDDVATLALVQIAV